VRTIVAGLALTAVACGAGSHDRAAPPAAWPVNVSTLAGNQMETTIAVDPTNLNRMAVASNNDVGHPPGLLLAHTHDGGRTWTHRIVAANGDDTLPAACCDPRLSWDSYGQLFLVYMTLATNDSDCALGRTAVVVARSIDGGRSFPAYEQVVTGCIDQPKIATGIGPGGAGSVWVAYRNGSNVVARGAVVHGRGAVGSLASATEAVLPGSRSGNFATVAVGPAGEVLVGYVTKKLTCDGCGLHTVVGTNVDPDGLGPKPFGGGVVVSQTDVTSTATLPAQTTRGTDPQPNVAYDRSDTHRGRAYVSYLDGSGVLTRVVVRTSADGVAWGAPVAVAADVRPASQFLPALAVDDATGRVGITYYDTVLDDGHGDADSDGRADTDADRYAVISADGGATFGTPVRLSRASSNSAYAHGLGLDYGDYTGMAFRSGLLLAAWADNSNTTGDNPDGRRASLDVYVAAVRSGG
jgi:hypothetical protein